MDSVSLQAETLIGVDYCLFFQSDPINKCPEASKGLCCLNTNCGEECEYHCLVEGY